MKRYRSLLGMIAAAAALFCVSACFASADTAAAPDHGIPVVYVNVDESEVTIDDMLSSEDHSVKCTGKVDIKVPDGYKSEWSGEVLAGLEDLELEYIRGRGNSTWAGGKDDKKPFKLKFTDKQSLLGMGADKEWALMANSYDHTFVANLISSRLGDGMGMLYSPHGVPVDFVLTGEKYGSKYLGCYVLSELVDIGENRLDIDKLKANTDVFSDDETKTGGYLLAVYCDSQDFDEPEETVFSTDNGIELISKNPEFDGELTESQKVQQEYIRGYIQDLEDLIMTDPINHDAVAEMMDMQSAADYWLIQELSLNADAYGTHSTYLYKPRNGKLCWGPLWDFDIAWGCMNYEYVRKGFNFTEMLWLDRLRQYDPAFREIIKERWSVLKENLEALTEDEGVIDQYEKNLTAAWNADHELWPMYEEDDQQKTYHEWLSVLKEFIEKRTESFDDEMEDLLGEVYATVTYKADGKVIAVDKAARLGNRVRNVPKGPAKNGYVFCGWYDETGENGIDDIVIAGDITFTAAYMPDSEAVAPRAVYFRYAEEWVPVKNKEYALSEYVVLPEEATDRSLEFTSSDTSVAVPSGDTLKLKGTGDTVITATTYNGISASMTLHVYDGNTMEKVVPVKISSKEASYTLPEGGECQIQVTIDSNGAPPAFQYVAFSSDNEDVAEVDSYGIVNAHKAGSAVITFTVCDEDDNSLCSGTCRVTVKGKEASVKLKNTLKVKGKTVKIKAKKLNKKARKIKRKKAVKVTGAKGKVTYKLVRVKKNGKKIKYKKAKKYFKVYKKTGNIKVKKKLKKGTYKVQVKVTAAGNSQYKAVSKKVTFKVKIK